MTITSTIRYVNATDKVLRFADTRFANPDRASSDQYPERIDIPPGASPLDDPHGDVYKAGHDLAKGDDTELFESLVAEGKMRKERVTYDSATGETTVEVLS